jgi:hypothetical protein
LCASRWFLVQKSKDLFAAIQEAAALQEGQGTVYKQRRGTTEGLLLTGIDLDSMEACVESIFTMSPSPYFRVVRRTYTDLFISQIQDVLSTDPKKLVKSENVWAQVHQKECAFEIITATTDSNQDKSEADRVLGLLESWVKSQVYDHSEECGCCFGSQNTDQGVTCRSNHFDCSVGSDDEAKCLETNAAGTILHEGVWKDDKPVRNDVFEVTCCVSSCALSLLV